MKHTKIISLIIIVISAFSVITACTTMEELNNAVTYTAQYSITYEVENTAGIITTIKKTVDGDGNVYFRSSEKELLFIKSGSTYTLYKKGTEGDFVKADTEESYTKTYVDTETSAIEAYTEKSKDKFMPGAERIGEEILVGRSCEIYRIKVGGESNGVTYLNYVDKATGVCLKYESKKIVFGEASGTDGEVFRATEYITSGVSSLKNLISK